jgi:hypothetical protein
MWTGALELLHHLSSTLRGPSWTRLESLQNERAISNFGCLSAQSIFPSFRCTILLVFQYYQILSNFAGKQICLERKCLKNAQGIYCPTLQNCQSGKLHMQVQRVVHLFAHICTQTVYEMNWIGNFQCEFYTFVRSNQELLQKIQLQGLWQESNLPPHEESILINTLYISKPIYISLFYYLPPKYRTSICNEKD